MIHPMCFAIQRFCRNEILPSRFVRRSKTTSADKAITVEPARNALISDCFAVLFNDIVINRSVNITYSDVILM